MTLLWALRAGVALLILALIGFVMFYRGNAIDARAEQAKAVAELALVVSANEQAQVTITRLTALRKAEDALLSQLGDEIGKLNARAAETTEAIADLGANDATVRDFLATPVPDSLRGLLK